MSRPFRCADDPDHVAKVHLTPEMLDAVVDFATNFEIPIKRELLKMHEAKYDGMTQEAMHEAIHMMLDELVTQGGDKFIEIMGKDLADAIKEHTNHCKGD